MPSPRRGAPANQRPRHRKPVRRDTPRPQPVASDLELALDAAAAQAADAPVSFAECGVPMPLVKALVRAGITAPFAIQTRALPDAIAGRDVLGRAQTGSGKTLAFGLPILAKLAGERSRSRHPRGLVLVPTRELAMQVADALRPLADAVGLRMIAVFGGVPYSRQVSGLERGADVVIATPGRLIDLIDRGACSLGDVSVAVLDEADHMADLGFLPAVTKLLDFVPAGGQRLLFSATLDRGVERLVRTYLSDPAVHAVAAAAAPVEAMEHRVLFLNRDNKVAVAAEIASRPARTLFFVRTKHGADRLAKQLGKLGAPAVAIHGNLSQNARQRALAAFAQGAPRVLVATDVAARGIHVDDVDLVVHFDPPNDHKDYLHRSGRTARAGASGTVVSLVEPDQHRLVQRIHRDARVTPVAVPVEPGHDAVRDLATSGVPVPPAPPVAAVSERSAGAGRREGRDSREGYRRSRGKYQPRKPQQRPRSAA